jgi:hypothetical protein
MPPDADAFVAPVGIQGCRLRRTLARISLIPRLSLGALAYFSFRAALRPRARSRALSLPTVPPGNLRSPTSGQGRDEQQNCRSAPPAVVCANLREPRIEAKSRCSWHDWVCHWHGSRNPGKDRLRSKPLDERSPKFEMSNKTADLSRLPRRAAHGPTVRFRDGRQVASGETGGNRQ